MLDIDRIRCTKDTLINTQSTSPSIFGQHLIDILDGQLINFFMPSNVNLVLTEYRLRCRLSVNQDVNCVQLRVDQGN